jgi:hypothetical protein
VDFFTVPTVTGRVLFVVIVLAKDAPTSRRVQAATDGDVIVIRRFR